MNSIIKKFKDCRRVGTPIIVINTTDQFALINNICQNIFCDDKTDKYKLIVWDSMNGLIPLNLAGEKQIIKIFGEASPKDLANITSVLTRVLYNAQSFEDGTVLFLKNVHKHFDDPVVCQGISNLRDTFKANKRTLVLLMPTFKIPLELEHDVIVFDEPMPNDENIANIIVSVCSSVKGMEVPKEQKLQSIQDALRGLSAFTAEEILAQSLTPNGVDMSSLWERKRMSIDSTPGLASYRGDEKFCDIGGYKNIQKCLELTYNGRRPFKAIAFIDEIEKTFQSLANGGDSAGISADTLQQLLCYMEDNRSKGIICIGHPGTGKSMVAKAAGNTFSVPTIRVDFGGMHDSLVGESENRLRNALKIISAVGSNDVLFIATCNSIAALPPELRRRFSTGTFFFDLPTDDEKKKIWSIYAKKFNIGDQDIPEDSNWTGSDIFQCVSKAYEYDCSLIESSHFISPVYRLAGLDKINSLRRMAHMRFLSASESGFYKCPYMVLKNVDDSKWFDSVPQKRSISLGEE
jgi:hypothetical protein